MFDVLQSCRNLNSGVFVEITNTIKRQPSRAERQKALRLKRRKEFQASLVAIKCPFANERIQRKWGWY